VSVQYVINYCCKNAKEKVNTTALLIFYIQKNVLDLHFSPSYEDFQEHFAFFIMFLLESWSWMKTRSIQSRDLSPPPYVTLYSQLSVTLVQCQSKWKAVRMYGMYDSQYVPLLSS
jgi:hypothetical protein